MTSDFTRVRYTKCNTIWYNSTILYSKKIILVFYFHNWPAGKPDIHPCSSGLPTPLLSSRTYSKGQEWGGGQRFPAPHHNTCWKYLFIYFLYFLCPTLIRLICLRASPLCGPCPPLHHWLLLGIICRECWDTYPLCQCLRCPTTNQTLVTWAIVKALYLYVTALAQRQ